MAGNMEGNQGNGTDRESGAQDKSRFAGLGGV